MKVVASNDQREIAGQWCHRRVENALRRLTANLLRITRGAGNRKRLRSRRSTCSMPARNITPKSAIIRHSSFGKCWTLRATSMCPNIGRPMRLSGREASKQ